MFVRLVGPIRIVAWTIVSMAIIPPAVRQRTLSVDTHSHTVVVHSQNSASVFERRVRIRSSMKRIRHYPKLVLITDLWTIERKLKVQNDE